jgi:hypothetical protein
MSKFAPVPQAPVTSGVESITNVASSALGGGKSGRYLFKVVPAAAFVAGTADQKAVMVWVTFSSQSGGTPATPVAGTTGWPIPMLTGAEFVLGEGVKFKAISDTTTVLLAWSRVSDE